MGNMEVLKNIKNKYRIISTHLNEKNKRLWVATEAKMLGYGGITILSKATGLARSTIHLGLNDLADKTVDINRIRRPGGGRKKIT